MKRHAVLQLGLLTATCFGLGTAACGGGDGSRNTESDGAGGMPGVGTLPTGTEPMATTPPTTSAQPTVPPQSSVPDGNGAGGSPGVPDDSMLGDAGSMAGAGGAPGTEPTCDILPLQVFPRSDSEAAWDDDDFSDVLVENGCPTLVDVTWPHEEGWQDADPSEANFEQTHFTLDAYYSTDLTDKQLNLTIELADDQKGPNATTTGGYIVSLVSVATYDQVVVVEPEAPISDGDAGADAGALTEFLDASVGGEMMDASFDGGVVDGGGAEEPMTIIQTGYVEAETLPEDRILLRHVGDRATITFPLPNKTEEVDSYDPSRVIKINVRIYNMFGTEGLISAPEDDMSELPEELDMGALGDAGMAAMGDAGMMDASVMDASVMDAGMTPMTDPDAPDQRYDYLMSQFAITSFTVTDRGSPAQ